MRNPDNDALLRKERRRANELERKITHLEDREAKRAEKETQGLRARRIDVGGEIIWLAPGARSGQLRYHPDGRVWKIGERENLVLVGAP